MSERNNDDSQELTLEEWQIQAIRQGIESADQGKLIHHSVVKEWILSWGTEDEKEVPKFE